MCVFFWLLALIGARTLSKSEEFLDFSGSHEHYVFSGTYFLPYLKQQQLQGPDRGISEHKFSQIGWERKKRKKKKKTSLQEADNAYIRMVSDWLLPRIVCCAKVNEGRIKPSPLP